MTTTATTPASDRSLHPRLRLLAFVVCLPALYGAWLLIGADDVTEAMLWLLLPALAAGIALSPRFYPLRLTDADTDFMNAAWKRTFADAGYLTLGYAVILFASAIASQTVDADLTVFPVGVLIAVMAGGTVLLGVIGSFLTLMPLLTLGRLAAHRLRGERGDVEQALGATLLLSVAVFATSLVLATSIDTGGSPRSEAWTAIVVLVTGLESQEARIVSQPLAWVARGALAGIVASAVPLAVMARRRKRAARA